MKRIIENIRPPKTRREFLKATGLVTASVAATALPSLVASESAESVSDSSTPSAKCALGTNFDQWKNRKVIDLATRSEPSIALEQAERHTIYSLALMAITLY